MDANRPCFGFCICAATARPGEATVTRIATDHGFYELGRFASRYRAVYGERPSETLRGHSGYGEVA